MKTVNELIQEYILNKCRGWATSTVKSTESRLMSVAQSLNGDPETLWDLLEEKDLGKYYRDRIWSQTITFWQWCLDRGYRKGPNHYRVYRQERSRYFRNAYKPRHPNISFEEAEARISTIQDDTIKAKAMQLLHGGLRWAESFTIRDGFLTGKGDSERKVFVDALPGGDPKKDYEKVLNALALIGLKPHDLRKLCASKLGREGLLEQDLCKAFGWKSIATAKYYLQPMKDEELAEKFRNIQGGKRVNSKEPVS